MKEALFIRQNSAKWKSYEGNLKYVSQYTPDELADIYIDLTNDLSFARTHYPNSKITFYLNNLSSRLHQYLNGRKRESFSALLSFWTQKLPAVMYDARKELLYSFLIFLVSILIGVISTLNDEEFPRVIMGNHYIDMTLDNIHSGDPMAVYKSERQVGMFLGISINNIQVSFLTFVSGIFTSVATAWVLLKNGIMIGAFHTLFAEHGLLGESLLTVWIHGTLEITAIILAGAAGIAMGNGWLFPGTYSRVESFRKGAKKGLKIIIGMVPVLIFAAFLESFLTRKTELPDAVRLAVIGLSLAFVVFYFVWWPRRLKAKS